eukprot:scaffold8889_cov100-Isochrysis_galbana.AAC.6
MTPRNCMSSRKNFLETNTYGCTEVHSSRSRHLKLVWVVAVRNSGYAPSGTGTLAPSHSAGMVATASPTERKEYRGRDREGDPKIGTRLVFGNRSAAVTNKATPWPIRNAADMRAGASQPQCRSTLG